MYPSSQSFFKPVPIEDYEAILLQCELKERKVLTELKSQQLSPSQQSPTSPSSTTLSHNPCIQFQSFYSFYMENCAKVLAFNEPLSLLIWESIIPQMAQTSCMVSSSLTALSARMMCNSLQRQDKTGCPINLDLLLQAQKSFYEAIGEFSTGVSNIPIERIDEFIVTSYILSIFSIATPEIIPSISCDPVFPDIFMITRGWGNLKDLSHQTTGASQIKMSPVKMIYSEDLTQWLSTDELLAIYPYNTRQPELSYFDPLLDQIDSFVKGKTTLAPLMGCASEYSQSVESSPQSDSELSSVGSYFSDFNIIESGPQSDNSSFGNTPTGPTAPGFANISITSDEASVYSNVILNYKHILTRSLTCKRLHTLMGLFNIPMDAAYLKYVRQYYPMALVILAYVFSMLYAVVHHLFGLEKSKPLRPRVMEIVALAPEEWAPAFTWPLRAMEGVLHDGLRAYLAEMI